MHSERTMHLELLLDNAHHSGVMWSGVSGQQLGKYSPNTSVLWKLQVIALHTGIQVTNEGIKGGDIFLCRRLLNN